MQKQTIVRNERGVALILALLITLAVAALAMGGVMIAGSGTLTSKFTAKEAALHSLADAGLEIARDSINRVLTLLPDTGHIVIAPASTVTDAYGNAIPGYTRTVYAGKTGGRTGGPATSGQYGSNFMSIVSVISDPRGAVAARRGLYAQESWSRFAVAINDYSANIPYGCASSVTGPLHSNDVLRIQSGCTSPKTLFAGEVTTVGSIVNVSSGNFTKGYTTGVPPLQWPTPAQLTLMRAYAQEADIANGDYDITGGNIGTNRPCTRLDFQVLDSNGDGVIQWDEGYVRVFRCNYPTRDSSLAYVNGRRWPSVPSGASITSQNDPNMVSPNCGAVTSGGFGNTFRTARYLWNNNGTTANKRSAVRAALTASSFNGVSYSNKRCYLGGDPRLFPWATGDTLLPDSVTANTDLGGTGGRWIRRRLGAHPSVTARRNTIAAGGDAEYWIPLGKNPNFKGVIYVTGDVAISGRLRGRVTVVATGVINLQDDFLYWVPPGTNCSETGDIFGALAMQNIVTQDNNLQTPFRVNGNYVGLFDDTPADESYHMFLLTLNSFGSDMPDNPLYQEGEDENPDDNGTDAIPTIAGEMCGNAKAGCIRIGGGIAYANMNWAGYKTYGSGTGYGWASGHSYDPCGATNPPPYFPTTGRYLKSRYYEIDPVWLNQTTVASYFRELQSR